MFTVCRFQLFDLDWQRRNWLLLFRVVNPTFHVLTSRRKIREVMQTYIKYCGGKGVLTRLWKIISFFEGRTFSFVRFVVLKLFPNKNAFVPVSSESKAKKLFRNFSVSFRIDT